jgi:hypothetical protein
VTPSAWLARTRALEDAMQDNEDLVAGAVRQPARRIALMLELAEPPLDHRPAVMSLSDMSPNAGTMCVSMTDR